MRKLCSFVFILLSTLLLPINALAVESHTQDDAIEVTVNINTAMADEIALMLQGIGEKKAQDIVDYRSEHGKFENIESLKQVKGIGQATIDKNKERILL